MNKDIIQGKWKQLAGQARVKWNKLTEDDLGVVDGHREYLVGKLQERYGWAKDQAEREVKQFESTL
ncbi:CsbD family protein [Tahibacter harae]|uniref:CsbD family protein n=1 Tax=Tahibacter harae TaxID=2963937 RepID=A0ABT1QXT3_9GAMM|nr:CsbD family protein [Tahibacter harae]MCQ4167087.1 CsbD family protein [Tahibacter harae]